jgi:hypothetical protein
MGKRIKSEKKGGGEESKFIEEYTPLEKVEQDGIFYYKDILLLFFE